MSCPFVSHYTGVIVTDDLYSYNLGILTDQAPANTLNQLKIMAALCASLD